MNNKDFIKIWLIGLIFITGLVAITVFVPLIVRAAYNTSTPLVHVMEK